MKVKVYLFLGLYILFCSQFNFAQAKPLYGEEVKKAKRNQFKFVVSIMRINNRHTVNSENEHICTGTLITPKDVATAEHCLLEEIKIGMRIIVGSIDFRQGKKHSIFWWLTYEQWAQRTRVPIEFSTNDVANIRLVNPVSPDIVPVEIPNIPNERLYRLESTALGWGISNGTNVEPILNLINLPIITNDECEQRVGDILKQKVCLDSRQGICTFKQPYAILSEGDSGGPLLYRNQLIGIHKGTCPLSSTLDMYPHLVNVHASLHYYKTFFISVIEF